jgi:AraC family transcriptional regulator, regulatory protein of adaptative response / methylated-DNA-[protein]-cysteine methyltransferase
VIKNRITNNLERVKCYPDIIYYSLCEGKYGRFIIAFTVENKICFLGFGDCYQEMVLHFTSSKLINKNIYWRLDEDQDLILLVKGTDFQIKVWQTLLSVESGNRCTYSDIAIMMNMPKSVRAVANAIAKNNIALLIPCHRVIYKNISKQSYRWGSEVKRKILANEITI